MENKVNLPRDELPHEDQAIEWWYFNGFLNGKEDYSFMTCLFKADMKKVNLGFLKFPVKELYFSHSILFSLTKKKIEKEILPFVRISDDSFKRNTLFVDYYNPLDFKYNTYEIARLNNSIRLKTRFFDLMLKENKKPLLEGGKGFIDLGLKTTYYYSYSNLKAGGFVGDDKVTGKAWHDKQWSEKGYMNDSWLWFSIQAEDNTEIVCFDYKGKKMATISYPDNKQETLPATFTQIGKPWTSKKTGLSYPLSWKIKTGKFTITTKPIMEDCEMNFGPINYWEGPLSVELNGKKAQGFLELVSDKKTPVIKVMMKQAENKFLSDTDRIKNYFFKKPEKIKEK